MQNQVRSTNWHSTIDRSIAIDLLAFPTLRYQLHTQPAAQELDKIHILYAPKFCRPTSGVVLKQSHYSA